MQPKQPETKRGKKILKFFLTNFFWAGKFLAGKHLLTFSLGTAAQDLHVHHFPAARPKA
jgi:hypothetical protein